jgi:hypothetical protein
MAIRDKSKASGLFSSANFSFDDLDRELVKQKSNSFKARLDEGDYDSFTWKDWQNYFKLKAKEYGVTKYVSGLAYKESSTIKSLMKNFSSQEIKNMMDFVWECDEYNPCRNKRKETLGIWIFSSGFLQEVAQLTDIWIANGTLRSEKDRPLTESKWEDKETSTEDSKPTKGKSRFFV